MEATDALARWEMAGQPWASPDAGLINRTWCVGDPPVGILQWVNPIFKPTVHLDIDAVTGRLAAQGLVTPRLIPTRQGTLWLDDDSGCWRMLSYVAGQTLHRVDSPARAAAAGALVGAFHAALAGWDYEFQHVRPGAHDTTAHMARLRGALDEADGHALAEPARALGEQVLDRWARWDGTLDLPLRICHGDLKLSNLRFDATGDKGVCLIDLDTLSHLPYAVEMGDAWRSWCNPAGEDDPALCRFDLQIFEASARAWLEAAPDLMAEERASLGGGVERICLELAARFCADAVRNTYFREDRERFPVVGAHNLWRARGQLNLACSAHDQRGACERILSQR